LVGIRYRLLRCFCQLHRLLTEFCEYLKGAFDSKPVIILNPLLGRRARLGTHIAVAACR
jgi:hypothetical protein